MMQQIDWAPGKGSPTCAAGMAHRTMPRDPVAARLAPFPGPEVGAADRLRGLAHGAFHEVVGGGVRAFDAALAVYAGENRNLRQRLEADAEVLKLVRSYAAEPWLRDLADQALRSGDADILRHLPMTLHDPELARAAGAEDDR